MCQHIYFHPIPCSQQFSHSVMALRAGTQYLPRMASRKMALGWGGAITVGLVAVSWRSLSHVGRGDIRPRFSINAFRTFFSASSFTTNTMTLTPPQAPPTWDHSAEDILKFTKESIETYRKVMDKVGALDPKDATFESVSLSFSRQTCLILSLPRYLYVFMIVKLFTAIRNPSDNLGCACESGHRIRRGHGAPGFLSKCFSDKGTPRCFQRRRIPCPRFRCRVFHAHRCIQFQDCS